MITILTGAPGHGKSFTMVKKIDIAMLKGKPVITNVPLREDWARVMVKRHMLFSRWRKIAFEDRVKEYERRMFMSDDIDELTRVRVVGTKEGRAEMLIDESQRKLNIRSYRDGGQKKLVDYVSGHRHYGFHLTLATQHIDNLDTQVKRLFEYHEEVRNFRRLPFFGSIFRMNVFMLTSYWNDKRKTKARPPEVYLLSKSLARLYRTHALNEVDWPEDAIILPRPLEAA